MFLTRTNLGHTLARVLMMAGALALLAVPALAQDPLPGSSPARKDCFRGRPLPECANYVISEIAYGRNGYSGTNFENNYATAEVGLMFNQGLRAAMGATLSQTWSEDNKLGVNFRYRWWMNPYFHLDLAPGVWFSARDMSTYSFDHVGFTTRASLMYVDAIGLEARFNTGNVYELGQQTEWTWGVRTGSYVSVVLGVATLGLFLIYAASVASTSS